MKKLVVPFLLTLFLFPEIGEAQVTPDFDWVQTIGPNSGNFTNNWSRIAMDDSGAVITYGSFYDTIDFDPGIGVQLLMPSAQGVRDVYVQKLDATGNFEWARSFGGSGQERIGNVAVDANNNIFICGQFRMTMDADPGVGVTPLTSNGFADAFVIKLDPAGNFLWAARFGGAGEEFCHGLRTDLAGNVLVGGSFKGDSIDLDPGVGFVPTQVADSSSHLFVVKLDANGNYVWGKEIVNLDTAGVNSSNIRGIGVDGSNNVYFAGDLYHDMDFDPDTGTFVLSSPDTGVFTSLSRGYICKLTASGQLDWARMDSTSYWNGYFALAVDAAGNSYTGGSRWVCNSWSGGGCTSSFAESFIRKRDAAGNPSWERNLGENTNWGKVSHLEVDDTGNLYVSGLFTDSLILGNGVNGFVNGFDHDAMIISYNPAGQAQWLYQIGPGSPAVNTPDIATGIAYRNGALAITGQFGDTVDFDAGVGSSVVVPQSFRDFFVLKLQNNCTSFSAIQTSLCGSYTLPSGSATVSAPGVYFDTLTNAQGCDSVLQITLGAPPTTAINVTACGSYVLPGGATATLSGTYIDTLVNGSNCDSIIITTNLTVNSTYNLSQTVTACGSYLLPSGQVVTTNGSYVDSLQSVHGCDSIVTFNITLLTTAQTQIFPVACDLYFTPGGQWANTSGVYADTLLTQFGCDSVVVYDLTVYQSAQTNQNAVACDSFLSPGGQWLTASGQYLDTLQTVNGCDSVVTTNLTIIPGTAATISVSACSSYTSPSGDYTWSVSGTFTDIIHNAGGCDSVLTINLSILGYDTDTIALAGCGSVTTPGGQVVTTSGWYLDTLTNANGCDSLVWTEAVIEPSFTTLIVDTICDPPYITPGGNEYGITGTYVETYTAQNGCDSTVTYQLEIGQVTFWVAISGQSLTVVAPLGSTYQWLDCNNNMAPVPGADSSSLPVLQFQNYAVVVTQGFCSDTSECILTESLGIGGETDQNGLKVYPNPNRGQFTIELVGSQTAEIEVVNPLGQVVLRERMHTNRQEVALDHAAAGTYWLRFRIDGSWQAVPVVVE